MISSKTFIPSSLLNSLARVDLLGSQIRADKKHSLQKISIDKTVTT